MSGARDPSGPRVQTALIATTHVDLHNERLAVSALEGMAQQIAHHYITAMINHDPRYPPYGRVIDATVVLLEDGEHGLEVSTEWFDGDIVAESDGRTMVVDAREIATFAVRYDRTVAQNDDQGDIAALGALSGISPEERGKKALEPVAELVLQLGLLTVGSIAAGFLAKLGADTWDALERVVTKRYKRRPQNELFELSIGLDVGYPCELLLIVEQPDIPGLEAFLNQGLSGIDRLVTDALRREPRLVRLVCLWRDGRFRLLYAVRPDGVPVLIDWDLVPALPAVAEDT